jgi:GNAT superfamily N-acetyltransferase
MSAVAAPAALSVRRAIASDAPEIARLTELLGYPATEGEIASRLDALLPLPAHFVAVAEAPRSGLLGWVAAECRMMLESGEQVEIVGLVVDSTHRRAGIGTRLAIAVEQWAASQGVAVLSVSSNIVRAQSHPFYERLGYARIKTRHAYVKRLASSGK